MDNKTSRSFKDIEEDANELVDEISNEKIKTENQINQLIEVLDLSYKDAEEQINNSVFEFNQKKKSFTSAHNQRLISASVSLKSSMDAYKKSSEWVKTQYQRILLKSFFALIIVIIMYNFVNSYVPWINHSIFGISIIQLAVIVFALYFILKSYHKVNNISNNNLDFLEKNRMELGQTKISSEDINISKRNFVDAKPIYENTKNLLGSLIINVGKTVPFISQTIDEVNLLYRYERLVNNFKIALNYFDLFEDTKFFDDLKMSAPSEIHIINDEEFWENIILEKITQRLSKQNISISNDIILLLYNNHNGLNSTNNFRKIKDSEIELINLAKILIDSHRLVQPPPNIAYSPQDIASVLKKVEHFNISEINDLLSTLIRLFDYLDSYLEFLEENEIKPNFRLNIDFIVEELESNIDSFEEQLVMLSYKIGYNIFSEIDLLNENFTNGFSRASIALKFHDNISLRKAACRYSAEDYATAIIQTYYEKAKDDDRQKAVSVKELLDDLKLINSFLDSKTGHFEFLKSQLREGTWYDSSAKYIHDYIKKYSEEIKEKISDIENYAILKESVTMVFQEVEIGTIEKAIDAQMFGAYVIMSDSSEGEFATLIDKLSIRNLSANEEKKWDYKSKSEIESIENRYGLRPKYDFMNFSKSTRIGVLTGESFLEFKNSFLKDIRIMLDKTNEDFKIGLVIQRITPSKYSFGIFETDELLSNVETKNLNIARYIARLGSDHVTFEDKMSVMRFEKEDIDLLKIVNMKSIYEIIRGESYDILPKERKILKSPELKKSILNEFENKLGINDFKYLALELKCKNINKNEVTPIVKNIFKKYFISEPGLIRNSEIRAERLSKRFPNALEKLAHIYELQQNK